MSVNPSVYKVEQQQLEQELLLHRAYFEAFDAIVANLMAPNAPSALQEALSILVDTAQCSAAGIYLDDHEHESARLSYYWARPQIPLSTELSSALRQIHYVQWPMLAEMLEVGMVLNKSSYELSYEWQSRFQSLNVQRIICMPLLENGVAFGFIAIFDMEDGRTRPGTERHFLAMLSNIFAQVLLKQRAEEETQASQQRLHALVSAGQDMVFEIDESGVVAYVWSGHPAVPALTKSIGQAIVKALPAELASELICALPSVLMESRSVQMNCTIKHQGVLYYLLARLSPIRAGDHFHAVAMIQDVTEIMQEASRRKTMLDTLNMLEEAVIDIAPSGELVSTTPAWARLRCIDPLKIRNEVGVSFLKWVHEDEQDAIGEAFRVLLASDSSTTQRFRLLREGNEPIWVEARLIAHHSPYGDIQGIRGVLRDVTVAYLNEQHITQLALYDTLTRLPNRLLLDDKLHEAIERARRNHTKVALGFIDLDHFKEVNDTFGHQVGDQLLVNVANQLSGTLRDNDLLARWGGDEFIAMMPDLPANLGNLREMAERLRIAAQQGVMLEGIEAKPTISVGFALFPDDAGSAEELLVAADHTMYHAKSSGRNNACFYSDIVHLKTFGREYMAIQTRLTNAIEDDSLQVFFQPVVDGATGDVLAVEALARWGDELGGWVSPEIFIPMAEKAGLIKPLSDRIMEKSFACLARWRENGLSQQLMVNISRTQLFSAAFIAQLTGRLTRFKLRPQDIILEITESVALTDYARQLTHLRQLQIAGFQIAIDDFGTGYSSLSQLHEMPVQFLKVDGSFTQRVHTEEGQAVMDAIVQMGHLLKLNVIVEGVENVETARYLSSIGVRRMQGFYFCEPVPANTVELSMRLGVLDHL